MLLKRIATNLALKINNVKIKKKLLIIYFVFGLMPLLFLGVFFISNTYKLILDQRDSQVISENDRTRNILFQITYLCSKISDNLIFDKSLRTLLSTQYVSDEQVYEAYNGYKLIDIFASSYTEISNIFIFVDNPTLISSSRYKLVDDDIRKSAWYQNVKKSSGEVIWMCGSTFEEAIHTTLFRKIPLTNSGDFAVIAINISNNYFKSSLKEAQYSTLLILDEQTVFYSSNSGEIGGVPKAHDIKLIEKDNCITTQYNGNNVRAYINTLKAPHGNNSFKIISIDEQALRSATSSAGMIAIIILIILTFPVVFIFIFTNHFSRRVTILREKMHEISVGGLTIVSDVTGSDELGQLFNDMKYIMSKINLLNEEIYAQKLIKQQLENQQQKIKFEMLSNQINPHFLFNTLETIRMKAIGNDQQEIAYIVKLLAALMRYSLQVQNTSVPLSSELKIMQTCLEIQHFRFGNRFNYSVSIDDDINADSTYILPILIQPIVENALIHGLKDVDEGGICQIQAKHTPEGLIISVYDNGVGMTKEEMKNLMDKMDMIDTDKTNIGMRNVNARIKLRYGTQYGIQIASDYKSGTTVSIHLPRSLGKGDK